MQPQNSDEAAPLRSLITIKRRVLAVLEQQAAVLSSAVPPHVVLQIEDTQAELTRLQADLRRIAPGPISQREPYMGLATFHEAQADLFYGRDELVTDLIERVRRNSFLAVLGASGSGKSSVVRAGLLPLLKGGVLPGSQNWAYLDPIRPGPHPLDRMAAALSEARGDSLADGLALSRALATSDQALLQLAQRLLAGRADARLVLVIDQAEELWTMLPTDAEQRSAVLARQHAPFLRLLVAAAHAPDSPVLTVLTMRSDFLPRVEDPAFARLIGEHDVIVTPMDERQLRAAIERPAEAAGGGFEPGLADELIAQTRGRSGALPLLEYALLELWKAREPDGMLTWAAYRRIGGLEGALAARADATLQHEYTPEQRDDLRQVLLRLVQPGEGAADTRRRVRLDDLTTSQQSMADLQVLLKPLVDERLLVVIDADERRATNDESSHSAQTTSKQPVDDGQDDRPSSFVIRRSSWVEVTHEALIRSWPTLGRWISESRGDLRFQLQLEDAAKEWQASDQNADLLWSGLRLSNAQAWLKRASPRLNSRDAGFLDASRAAAAARLAAQQAEAEAREQARQRELDQAHALVEAQHARAEEQSMARRQLRGRARLLAGALVIALLAGSAAGWFGVEARRNAADAEEKANTAATAQALAQQQASLAATAQAGTAAQLVVVDSQRLAFAARSQFDSAPETALLLAYEAVKRSHNLVNEQTLRDALDRTRPVVLLSGHTELVSSAVFSPDGQRILTASYDNTARLWDGQGQPLATLSGHTDQVNSAVFSPDGQRILTASVDGTARQYLVELNDLLKVAACHVGRGLMDEEVARFSVPTPLAFDFSTRVCPAQVE